MRRLSWMVLPLLLAGCAGIGQHPASPESIAGAQGAVTRTYREDIDLGGRMSVRYEQNGKEEAVHGSFTWAQTPRRSVVTLLSPLGQTIATIELTPAIATLTQAGRAPKTATDVDALAAEALGWPLPIAGMRDWLQGFVIDAKGRHAIANSQESATAITTKDGWRLLYGSWQEESTPPSTRPKRIDFTRSTAQAGEVAIRIVIDSWQVH